MKLRIQNDSLRLRLTRPEVDHVAEAGRVEATITFGPGRALRYALEAAAVDQLQAHYTDDAVVVQVPRAWVRPWAASEQVGFAAEQPLPDGETLHLLVEKDFQCLHRREEEEAMFPHPEAG